MLIVAYFCRVEELCSPFQNLAWFLKLDFFFLKLSYHIGLLIHNNADVNCYGNVLKPFYRITLSSRNKFLPCSHWLNRGMLSNHVSDEVYILD